VKCSFYDKDERCFHPPKAIHTMPRLCEVAPICRGLLPFRFLTRIRKRWSYIINQGGTVCLNCRRQQRDGETKWALRISSIDRSSLRRISEEGERSCLGGSVSVDMTTKCKLHTELAPKWNVRDPNRSWKRVNYFLVLHVMKPFRSGEKNTALARQNRHGSYIRAEIKALNTMFILWLQLCNIGEGEFEITLHRFKPEAKSSDSWNTISSLNLIAGFCLVHIFMLPWFPTLWFCRM